MVAEDGHGRRRRSDIRGRQNPATERGNAQRGEVISGHELGVQSPCRRLYALTPDAHAPVARLESGHVFKFGCLCPETLKERIGKHSPAILGPAFYAAIVSL